MSGSGRYPGGQSPETSVWRVYMEYATEIVGEKGYIIVEGDLDSEQAGEALRKAFNNVYDRGKKTVVLDLGKVQIINSYGIGKVLMCYKRLKAENGVLMVRPLQGFVKETFELLMLDKLLPVDE
jgi:anti-anti-sigma factor